MGTACSDGSIITTWSEPFCINSARDGQDGQNGKDGDSIQFIFKICVDEAAYDAIKDIEPTGDNPDGWTDSPTGIDSDHIIEAVSTRRMQATTGQ